MKVIIVASIALLLGCSRSKIVYEGKGLTVLIEDTYNERTVYVNKEQLLIIDITDVDLEVESSFICVDSTGVKVVIPGASLIEQIEDEVSIEFLGQYNSRGNPNPQRYIDEGCIEFNMLYD